MFEYIKGQLEELGTDHVVIDVCGIGYTVFISKNTAFSLQGLKSEVKLYTHLKLKDEDITVYGFINKAERDLYLALNSVSGVGPKAAMAILSSNPSEKIISAIINNDSKALSAAPGIGVKTANRIIVDLKDKFGDFKDFAVTNIPNGEQFQEKRLCVEALISLGYTYSMASAMVDKTFKENCSTQENILAALSVAHSV